MIFYSWNELFLLLYLPNLNNEQKGGKARFPTEGDSYQTHSTKIQTNMIFMKCLLSLCVFCRARIYKKVRSSHPIAIQFSVHILFHFSFLLKGNFETKLKSLYSWTQRGYHSKSDVWSDYIPRYNQGQSELPSNLILEKMYFAFS